MSRTLMPEPALPSAPPFGGKRSALLQKLRSHINDGTYKVGETLPPERFLAAHYQVGRNAIRQAINDLESLGLVRQEPNCRPIVARSEPNRPFGSTKQDQIAVWISPDLQDFGASKMLEGIRTVIGSDHRQLIIGCPPSKDPELLRGAVSRFVQSLIDNPKVAGAILWAVGDPLLTETYERLMHAQIPVVYIDREPPESVSADVVTTNHRRAARRAVRHLVDLGHRRIAVVSNDDRASSVRDRLIGFREGFAEAGLDLPSTLLCEVGFSDPDRLRADSQAAIDQFIRMPHPPSAILAVNDSVAMYLCDAIRQKGLRVPEDISVVGFDWLMRWMPSGGELTTVAQPFGEMGEVAAQCLLERIGPNPLTTHRHILLEAPLVVKTSTAAPSPLATGGFHPAPLGE